MAQYIPGTEHRLTFTVSNRTGGEVTGLTWTLTLFVKDGTKVTSGDEFNSISVVEDANGFYEALFTADENSTSEYMLKLVSDADPADVFEEVYTPNWTYIVLFANMVDNRGADPQTITYKLPGGDTLKQFQMTRSESTVLRTGV